MSVENVEVNNDGTCGNCGNDLKINKSYRSGPDCFRVVCSSCGAINYVSKIRLEQAEEINNG